MNTLRKLKAAVAAAFLIAACSAVAQDYFTYTGTAQGATNSYAIIPKRTGVPCVFFIDATIYNSDNTNSVPLVFYTAGPEQNITRAGTTGTNTVYVGATNGWVVGDILLLSRTKETVFERHTVSVVAAGVLTITGTTGGPTVAGDKIYRMSISGRIRHKADQAPAVMRVVSGNQPVFSGAEGRPALIEMQGSLTNVLGTASGRWLPPTLGK